MTKGDMIAAMAITLVGMMIVIGIAIKLNASTEVGLILAPIFLLIDAMFLHIMAKKPRKGPP